MTYVIVKRSGAENTMVHVEGKKEAQDVIKGIVDGLYHVLNPMYLSITHKEDDLIVMYNGEWISTVEIREDDEVDILPTNG